jgi:hypothetical protein
VGECKKTVQNCVEGKVQTCVPGTPSDEICDLKDNDCDGLIDEGLGSTTCGIGECKKTVQNCVEGKVQTCVPGTPSDEICDLKDNDCDGLIDEGLGSTTCGLGPCQKTVQNCINGVPQTCVPGIPGTEICGNGIDDDCDGQSDENCPCPHTQGYWKNHPDSWPVASLIVGGVNYTKLQAIAIFKTPPKGDATYILIHQLMAAMLNEAAGAQGTYLIEQTINEANDWLIAHPLGSNPQGAEREEGIALSEALDEYNSQVMTPNCGHGCEPYPEICDGKDNDCDGWTDESLGSATCGVGECLRTVQNCVNGVSQTCVPGTPTAEICDGKDNDCDASVDEGLGTTTCGVGMCQKTVQNCINGVPQSCVPGTPATEICDSKDNDCDGSVDEGFPAQCKNTCIISDACINIAEAFARGWIETYEASSNGAIIAVKNNGSKNVCIDESIVEVSDATQSLSLQPFTHTGYSPPTAGSQIIIPAYGVVYFYYSSWTFANGYYQPYFSQNAWWCLEWGQLAKNPATFYFDGETLPDALEYFAYQSTNTNGNCKEDHVEWYGSYGTKAQYNMWNWQSSYPVITAGKTAAAGSPGKIVVVLTARNLGAVTGSGVLSDTVPAGYTASNFSVAPSQIITNCDGSKTLKWNVTVQGYYDPSGTYYTTTFYTVGISYDLTPPNTTNGARIFLPRAQIVYCDGVTQRTEYSVIPVAVKVDVDGDGIPSCTDCNDFNPGIGGNCPQ